MEPYRDDNPPNDAKRLTAGCEQTFMGGLASQSELNPPSDKFDAVPPEHQPTGKLRRTALRFFGRRKSICVLPNFFGGRNKHFNKWSSKNGVSKSKTHDGFSKTSWEDNLGTGSVPAGYLEYHSQKDPAVKIHDTCCSELGHPTGEPKSFSLPRQKKGLRGLFNSIRRHKKHRNSDFENNEMSHVCNKEVRIAQNNNDQNDTLCLGILSESNVPDLANVKDCLTVASECINVDVIVSDNDTVNQGSLDSLTKGEAKTDHQSKHKVTLHANTETTTLPNSNLESSVNVQLPTVSSQMSLIFCDVASLKSFDSLTGCGDIIADQDDDSIAESTVSGERSRNAGKRSSCCVTYQGGGEEMATPEVDGDYIQALWQSEGAEGVCYTHSKEQNLSESPRMSPEEPSSSYNMDISSNSNGALGDTETSLTSVDVMTPQSDHQESVPNSDEGYYDSTTPGQDEDGHDKVDRIRTVSLPRDSYSGDALYELFEPDDSLISPPFEKSKLPVPDPLQFLDIPAQCSDAVVAVKTGLNEEDRLTLIQQDLLCAELQNMCRPSKEQTLFTKGRIHQDCFTESISKVNTKSQSSMKEDQVNAEALNKKVNIMLHGSHALKENVKVCNGGKSGKMPSNNSSDAVCSTQSSKMCQTQMYSEQIKPESPQVVGFHDPCKKSNNDLKDEQTVCFSQALMDFSKHSNFCSNSNESLGGSESDSPFAQNMQALPAIITFDVVDIDNEGEYDQQMDMEEEDITSPYEVFEESYLQKDAFAECDLRMFDLYEQSLLSNTWGIASLPRHLSLTQVKQSNPLGPLPSPLALNRRSRSLDTESLELELTDMYLGSGAQLTSCPRTEKSSKRASSLHRKKNGNISTSENSDNRSIMLPSWQPETEGTVTRPQADGKRTEQLRSLYQTPNRQMVSFSQPVTRVPNFKSHQITASNVTDRVSCKYLFQITEPLHRPSHLLQSESCGLQPPGCPHAPYGRSDKASDGGGEALFHTSTVGLHSYTQHCKMRPVGITQGMPHLCSESDSPLSLVDYEQQTDFTSNGRKAADMVCPVGCIKQMSSTNP
ncbi:APC membrane recruitment protein 1 [Esox lucius]|nr:APC membrane recruitment protein 1 [Esox lucius]